MDKLLTVATLVSTTELSESFFRKAIASGKLPALRVGKGRAIRVRASDAERFLLAPSPTDAHQTGTP